MQSFDQDLLLHPAPDSGYAADMSGSGGWADQLPRSADAQAFQKAVLEKLTYGVGTDAAHATDHDWFIATALAARDRAIDRWTIS